MAGTKVATSHRSLIRLQRLSKARHELELSRLALQMIAIDDENDTLLKMLDDRFGPAASLVPVSIILKRIGTNTILQTRLAQRIDTKKADLLKTSRTLDLLCSRLRTHENALERLEAAAGIDEYISQLLGKHTN